MSEKKFDTLKQDYQGGALQLSVQYGGEGNEQAVNDDQQLYTIKKFEANADPEFPTAYDSFTFADGTSVKLILSPQDQQYYTFDAQSNNWVLYSLQQKIYKLQQQYLPEQQQQQKQVDGPLTLKVTLTDNNSYSKYEGSLTEEQIQYLTNKNYDVQSLFDHIKDYVSNALDNIEEVKLTVGDEFCILNSKLKIQVGRQHKEYNVQCKLNKLIISREDRQDLQTNYLSKLMHKQDVKIAYLEKELFQFQIEKQNLIIQQTQSDKKTSLLEQIVQQLQSLKYNLLKKLQESDLRINQLEKQLKQHVNKPQPNRVSLSSLQQGDNGYLKTNVLQKGFHEFVAVLQDNEVEFEIGILADGDFEELETLARAFYFEFPAGKFRRGAGDTDKIITYSFQRNTKIGIKVNTNEHWATVSFNGYDFAPICLPNGVENFAFIIKIITEYVQLDDVLEELEQ